MTEGDVQEDAPSTNTEISPPWHQHVDGAPIKAVDTIESSTQITKKVPSIYALLDRKIYQQEDWQDKVIEALFHIKERGTSVNNEIYCGVIHYITCLYCLTVVPQQLKSANYASIPTIVIMCLCMGIGSILCGLFSNLPFIVAPPTVISIFLAVFVRKYSLQVFEANIAVMVTGAVLLSLFIYRPFGKFVTLLIPNSIQVGTAIGIGLLTCLAGSIWIDMVVVGQYTILTLGPLTNEIYISIAGVAVIVIGLHYHVKGAFCIALILCSLLWWLTTNEWPKSVFGLPYLSIVDYQTAETQSHNKIIVLIFDLLFLSVLYLNGLVISFSNLAQLTKQDEDKSELLTVPRSRWVYVMCGVFTIVSGCCSGPPMLLSPESGAAIKAGAKTGLSAIVCGVFFLLSMFLAPLFESTPPAGTAPLLIAIGMVLFQNCSRLDWKNVIDTAPAYVILFYVPFTYSLITGIVLGYLMYFVCAICTGRLHETVLWFCDLYSPTFLAPLWRQFASFCCASAMKCFEPFFRILFDEQDPPSVATADSSEAKRKKEEELQQQYRSSTRGMAFNTDYYGNSKDVNEDTRGYPKYFDDNGL